MDLAGDELWYEGVNSHMRDVITCDEAIPGLYGLGQLTPLEQPRHKWPLLSYAQSWEQENHRCEGAEREKRREQQQQQQWKRRMYKMFW